MMYGNELRLLQDITDNGITDDSDTFNGTTDDDRGAAVYI
jgi:hypothetical protein